MSQVLLSCLLGVTSVRLGRSHLSCSLFRYISVLGWESKILFLCFNVILTSRKPLFGLLAVNFFRFFGVFINLFATP